MVEIRVLGPLEIVGADGAIPLRALKQQLLLASLVVRAGETLPSDLLIDALWGGTPPASAGKLLQVYVSKLRRALPAAARIRTHGSGYALELEEGSLDVARFERLLEEGRAASREGNPALAASRLGRALALWRGPAYGELAYEEFARSEAERLDELRLVALEERVEAELALGHHAELLPELQSLAGVQPLRERLHAQAMLALYRCGRQSEALEIYATARRRLHDELGLEPNAELRDLQRRILQHDASLAAPTAEHMSGGLPASPNVLLGRERELRKLRELLLREEVRLLVLTGAGGSGKTRLALEAARECAASFANGAALVDLAPLRDPHLLPAVIAQSLGLQELPGEPLETLASALRPRELLLLLDNAEHLRIAAPLFVDLLARAPRLTLLVTSRVVLHLSGEHVYPVDPLAEEAAGALFLRRAHEADARFDPDATDVSTIRRICERLDGLPLAIELAAGNVRTLAPSELLDRLDARLPLLRGGARDLPARQQTLRATLDWSFNLLAKDEQRDLTRLAVFAGGFTLEAARAACDTTVESLSSLVDHNLVQRMTGPNGSRYTMLETIREYALERLEEGGAADEWRRRHAEHFLALAERSELELKGKRQAEWLELLEQDYANLRAALAWSLRSGTPDLGLRLAGALTIFWSKRGYFGEGRRWLADAMVFGDHTKAEARALFGAALLAGLQGDWPEAKRWSTACRKLSLTLGESSLAADSTNTLGRATLADDPEHARLLFEEAYVLAREVGDLRVVGFSSFNLGYTKLSAGDYVGARASLETAREVFEAISEQYGVARSLAALSSVALHEDHLDEAVTLLRQSLALSQRLGDTDDLAWGLQLMGVALAESQSARAAQLLGAAERLRERVGVALHGSELALHERAIAALRSALDVEVVSIVWAAGRELSVEEAVKEALSGV